MGRVGTSFEATFLERESNYTMMYLDFILFGIGIVTSLFGIYVDGFTYLLSFLLTVSIMMGCFGFYRLSQERKMKADVVGEFDGEPPHA